MTLRERVHEIRAEVIGTHQGADAEFADLIGVSRSAVSQLMSGEIKALKAVTAFTIQEKTGFSARWLVLGVGQKKVTEMSKNAVTPPQVPWQNENRLLAIIRAYEQADDRGKDAIWGGVQVALKRRGISATKRRA